MDGRAEAATPDEVVAVIPAPFAIDALDRDVATSLSVNGSTVTMSGPHGAGSAYPIVAGRELMNTQAVAAAQALEATAATPEHTSEQPEETEVADPGPPAATAAPSQAEPMNAQAGSSESDEELEELDHGSAYQDEDDQDGADDEFSGDASAARGGDGTLALRGAALERLTKIRVGLTESHPSMFRSLEIDSPRRQGDTGPTRLQPAFYRPFVPWNFVYLRDEIMGRPAKPEDTPNAAQNVANERYNERTNRAAGVVARWNAWLDQYNTVGPRAPVDLVIGPDPTAPNLKAPIPRTYQSKVNSFLTFYRDRKDGPTFKPHNLMAWNEPNFNKRMAYPDPGDPRGRFNPLDKAPRRAAELWMEANNLCNRHCLDGGSAVAGDFSGSARSARKFRHRPRGESKPEKVNYEDLYARTIRTRPQTKRPRVWAFHAYADTRAYVAHSGETRFRAPVTRRYHRLYTEPDYNYRFRAEGGQIQERGPAIWLTEVGAPYWLKCRGLTDDQRRERCTGVKGEDPPGEAPPRDIPPNEVNQLFGMRLQQASIAFLFRTLAQLDQDTRRIQRVYYYALHNVTTRQGADGRCDNPDNCPDNDWGLIGSDDDAVFANAETTDRRHAKEPSVSTSAHPRRAFCVLRDQSVMNGFPRPKRFNKPSERFGPCGPPSNAGPRP